MNVKAIMIGDSCVGKTRFLNCIRSHRSNGEYTPTVGVDFLVYHSESPSVNIQVWDTSGNDRFKGVVYTFLKGVDLCIFVYKDKVSFDSMMKSIIDVKEKKHGKWYCILCTGSAASLGRSVASQYGYLFFEVDVADEVACTNTLDKIALFCVHEEERTRFLQPKSLETETIAQRFHCWFPFC